MANWQWVAKVRTVSYDKVPLDDDHSYVQAFPTVGEVIASPSLGQTCIYSHDPARNSQLQSM
jgi:hypothetical protein